MQANTCDARASHSTEDDIDRSLRALHIALAACGNRHISAAIDHTGDWGRCSGIGQTSLPLRLPKARNRALMRDIAPLKRQMGMPPRNKNMTVRINDEVTNGSGETAILRAGKLKRR
ncbi:hypothetical protein [Novosphingobium terrae]|uniref:hypothetical protein n=1 Tax=Novosphingobium terrae TaxID=2726189 RepID=UPI00197CD745|nr:hypothetical protein [Novosphingobium terrae]